MKFHDFYLLRCVVYFYWVTVTRANLTWDLNDQAGDKNYTFERKEKDPRSML